MTTINKNYENVHANRNLDVLNEYQRSQAEGKNKQLRVNQYDVFYLQGNSPLKCLNKFERWGQEDKRDETTSKKIAKVYKNTLRSRDETRKTYLKKAAKLINNIHEREKKNKEELRKINKAIKNFSRKEGKKTGQSLQSLKKDRNKRREAIKVTPKLLKNIRNNLINKISDSEVIEKTNKIKDALIERMDSKKGLSGKEKRDIRECKAIIKKETERYIRHFKGLKKLAKGLKKIEVKDVNRKPVYRPLRKQIQKMSESVSDKRSKK